MRYHIRESGKLVRYYDIRNLKGVAGKLTFIREFQYKDVFLLVCHLFDLNDDSLMMDLQISKDFFLLCLSV
jgi:hypothetical protein